MFRITTFSLLTIVVFSLTACAQTNRTIAFYNVENLFDTFDDPEKDDQDFLPTGKLEWNEERYQKKLAHLNETISLFESPLLIGLCEVENERVVRDLVNHGKLKSSYGVVHYESGDNRGIDVALIYDSITLKLQTSGFIRYAMPEGDRPTRDIVWAKMTYKKDTILAMVNHWPSRSGGAEASEHKRLIAANAARKFIDSVQVASPTVKIVLMGDLNDYPTDKAPQLVSEILTPMITKSSGKYGGTYNYRGEWDVLDHIMVSSNFSSSKRISVVENSGKIYSDEFLLDVYKGDTVPKRNYGGIKYLEGYSDHLPVSIGVRIR